MSEHSSLKPVKFEKTEREASPLILNELEIRRLRRKAAERTAARDHIIKQFTVKTKQLLKEIKITPETDGKLVTLLATVEQLQDSINHEQERDVELRELEREVLTKLNAALDKL